MTRVGCCHPAQRYLCLRPRQNHTFGCQDENSEPIETIRLDDVRVMVFVDRENLAIRMKALMIARDLSAIPEPEVFWHHRITAMSALSPDPRRVESPVTGSPGNG